MHVVEAALSVLRSGSSVLKDCVTPAEPVILISDERQFKLTLALTYNDVYFIRRDFSSIVNYGVLPIHAIKYINIYELYPNLLEIEIDPVMTENAWQANPTIFIMHHRPDSIIRKLEIAYRTLSIMRNGIYGITYLSVNNIVDEAYVNSHLVGIKPIILEIQNTLMPSIMPFGLHSQHNIGDFSIFLTDNYTQFIKYPFTVEDTNKGVELSVIQLDNDIPINQFILQDKENIVLKTDKFNKSMNLDRGSSCSLPEGQYKGHMSISLDKLAERHINIRLAKYGAPPFGDSLYNLEMHYKVSSDSKDSMNKLIREVRHFGSTVHKLGLEQFNRTICKALASSSMLANDQQLYFERGFNISPYWSKYCDDFIQKLKDGLTDFSSEHKIPIFKSLTGLLNEQPGLLYKRKDYVHKVMRNIWEYRLCLYIGYRIEATFPSNIIKSILIVYESNRRRFIDIFNTLDWLLHITSTNMSNSLFFDLSGYTEIISPAATIISIVTADYSNLNADKLVISLDILSHIFAANGQDMHKLMTILISEGVITSDNNLFTCTPVLAHNFIRLVALLKHRHRFGPKSNDIALQCFRSVWIHDISDDHLKNWVDIFSSEDESALILKSYFMYLAETCIQFLQENIFYGKTRRYCTGIMSNLSVLSSDMRIHTVTIGALEIMIDILRNDNDDIDTKLLASTYIMNMSTIEKYAPLLETLGIYRVIFDIMAMGTKHILLTHLYMSPTAEDKVDKLVNQRSEERLVTNAVAMLGTMLGHMPHRGYYISNEYPYLDIILALYHILDPYDTECSYLYERRGYIAKILFTLMKLAPIGSNMSRVSKHIIRPLIDSIMAPFDISKNHNKIERKGHIEMCARAIDLLIVIASISKYHSLIKQVGIETLVEKFSEDNIQGDKRLKIIHDRLEELSTVLTQAIAVGDLSKNIIQNWDARKK